MSARITLGNVENYIIIKWLQGLRMVTSCALATLPNLTAQGLKTDSHDGGNGLLVRGKIG